MAHVSRSSTCEGLRKSGPLACNGRRSSTHSTPTAHPQHTHGTGAATASQGEEGISFCSINLFSKWIAHRPPTSLQAPSGPESSLHRNSIHLERTLKILHVWLLSVKNLFLGPAMPKQPVCVMTQKGPSLLSVSLSFQNPPQVALETYPRIQAKAHLSFMESTCASTF